jgi:hypothetical protein
MRNAIFFAAAFIIATATSTSAQAVEVKFRNDGPLGPRIFVQDEFVPGSGDLKKFLDVAAKYPKVKVVSLSSPGGDIGTAFGFGQAVRMRHVITLVEGNNTCASACSLIWLSSDHATIQRNGLIGFHATSENGQPSPEGDFEVEAYLRDRLHLGYDQRKYILGTPHQLIRFLSRDDADYPLTLTRTNPPALNLVDPLSAQG